jgi:S-adenosylmethionine hydrolase
MSAIITLTTDFGLADAYVAAMKGVILGINPHARLVDICHTIQPQNISRAAFILDTAYKFFPQRTIHLVVVDPGVGSRRKAVILRTPVADFIAPDNGVLSYIVQDYAGGSVIDNRQPLDTGQAEAIEITSRQYWRPAVSPTFHGRDVFAPVAAHLSLGIPLTEFGNRLDSLVTLPLIKPRQEPDATLAGSILHIDNFGNLTTNIKRQDLPPETTGITVEVKGQLINGIVDTYAMSDGLCALIGSGEYLEIALKDGDASAFLNAAAGDEVKIKHSSQ